MLKTMLAVLACVAMLLAAAAAPTAATAQTMFRPVAVVNDSAITGYDLAQRAQIMTALGFTAASADALRAAALDRLIEDRLKMQEAKRGGLTASPEQVAAGIAEFAQNSRLSEDELRATLSAQGVTEQALRDLVAADVVWRDMVRARFAHRIEPGEAEINGEIALMGQRAGVSYHIAEIGLPLTDAGRSEAETLALANQLADSLSQGGDFDKAVRTYSRAPSAARGGDVGWVPGDRIPPEISAALAALQPGQVTRPVQVSGGYSILKLIETRSEGAQAVNAQDPELRDRVRRGLINQQTARLAEGLLQELRRDALIELR
jgi:peptidyl-prolyl cis-trans isomerase SurA